MRPKETAHYTLPLENIWDKIKIIMTSKYAILKLII